MRWLKISLLVFTLYSNGLQAAEYKFYQQDIAKTVVLEETGDVLSLRGVALHKHYFQDDYIGAFYSLNALSEPAQALSDAGPKRMWLFFLHDSTSLKDEWEQAIIENNSPSLAQREQISLSRFLKMIDSPVHKGDILMIDYVPNVGTEVILKGSARGIIKGNEFYNLLLKVWMGRQPPSQKFKKDLFNLS